MNYPMQQNYGGGLGALGPVQSMSDRNDAQMMMVNRGQMFANGGITALAKGGLDALPKYKYDPVTQTYKLDEGEKKEETSIQNLARPEGSSSVTPATSAWDTMTNAQKAAYYADNPRMAAITQGLQKGFGMTGLGQLAAFFSPDETGKAQAVAKGFDPSQTSFGRGAGSLFGMFGRGLEAVPVSLDAYGYGMPGQSYGMMGPNSVSGIGVHSREGINAMDAMSDAAAAASGYGSGFGLGISDNSDSVGRSGGNDTGGGGVSGSGSGDASDGGGRSSDGSPYARGGIASLAHGGPSHLGDYSDGGRFLRNADGGTTSDGISDSIPASIGGKRPARLAENEFVIPARIVSELGNGSSEAGARRLYAMMDRIQKARGKTVGKGKVAVDTKPEKLLPI